jgi:hypothetical protein
MKTVSVKIRSTHDAVESAIDMAKKSASKRSWGAILRSSGGRIQPWVIHQRPKAVTPKQDDSQAIQNE